MRYRFRDAHKETSQRPKVEWWPNQPDVVPIHADGESDWSFNLLTYESATGYIDGSAVAVGATAERYVPGVCKGVLYKVTISHVSTQDDIVVTLGGAAVATLDGGQTQTKVVYVRPTDDSGLLKFSHSAGTTYTGSIREVKIESMGPVNFDLMLIPERGV
jgi:S1-C subfamily serine protease